MELLVVLIIGFVSSVFGSFISGGLSVLAFTLLGAYGLSPLLVFSTFKVGAFGSQFGGLYNYHKAGKILWDKVLIFTLLGVPAAYLGTSFVISIPEELLERVIGVVLLICLPLSLLKPELGVVSRATSATKQFFGHIFYFATSVYAYTFVVGAGIIGSYVQSYFYGMTLLESKGTSRIPVICKGLVSVFVLSGAGVVDWKLGGAFFIGAFIGSFLGTHYTIKVGDAWLRKILLVTVFVVSIKLLLGI